MNLLQLLAMQDPEVWGPMLAELIRQEDGLELIASENTVSTAVMAAMGTWLNNKYAEGLPGKRYYGGCECVDEVENLAIERARALFKAPADWIINVQPHSGAQANAAVLQALCSPGDTIMGLNLSHGGHLSHGSPANSSGKLYKVVAYHVDEVTGRIDMNRVRELALEHRPKVIIAGFSAYPRSLDFAAFRAIADEVGAVLMADIAHVAGLVVAGVSPDPVPFCDVVTTTTHKTLRGPRGGLILAAPQFGKAINSGVFPGTQGGPLMHVIAAKAVAFREAQQPAFREYASRTVANAAAMARRLTERGIQLVSGGTDNHLMLIDLGELCTGKEAEAALGSAHLTCNKNTVPGEKRSPFVTSGIRLGTPAITTRGLREDDCRQVADWVAAALEHRGDAEVLDGIRAQVTELCRRFPVYPELTLLRR